MSTRIAPSAALEAIIEELLADGLGDGERLTEVGGLGARLVLQRAVAERRIPRPEAAPMPAAAMPAQACARTASATPDGSSCWPRTGGGRPEMAEGAM